MIHRSARAALLVAAVALAVSAVLASGHLPGQPASARADGDPASDVLYGADVFFPYQPLVSPALQRSLTSLVASAKRAGYPLKVALVATPNDLGSIPNFFDEPARYAQFLSIEIAQAERAPTLVVMPAGFGLAENGQPFSLAPLAGVSARAARGSSDFLAQRAILAVRRLAAAAGHPLPSAATRSAGGGSGSTVVAAIVIAALAALGVVTALWLRRRGAARA